MILHTSYILFLTYNIKRKNYALAQINIIDIDELNLRNKFVYMELR